MATTEQLNAALDGRNYNIFPDGRTFVMLSVLSDSTASRQRLIAMMNLHLRSRTRDKLSER